MFPDQWTEVPHISPISFVFVYSAEKLRFGAADSHISRKASEMWGTLGSLVTKHPKGSIYLFKSPIHNVCMKSESIRTLIDLPRDLHRRVHEAAARRAVLSAN
jgi:hypothetical protein